MQEPDRATSAVRRNAHLNLVDSSQRLFELDSGAEVAADGDCLLGAGRASHPTVSNAAFRVDDDLDPNQLIERAQTFFAARRRGFGLWARGGVPEDRDLIDALGRAGLEQAYAMPEMILGRRAEEPSLPPGVEVRRVESPTDAEQYWQVATESYASLGFPPEIFAFYDDHSGLSGDGVIAFLAHLHGEPAGIAMTIVSHGIGGIYWVGSMEKARGRGLGSALTATAVNAGFEMGAEIASLQASPMGESLYRRMGCEAIYEYRLFASPRPG